jgi:hypothetical protein
MEGEGEEEEEYFGGILNRGRSAEGEGGTIVKNEE